MTAEPHDSRSTVRAALMLAHAEQSSKTPLSASFLDRATELIAGPEADRADAAVTAARALAAAMAAYRDLLDDAAYSDALLPFEVLRLALPNAEEVVPLRPRLRVVEDGPDPWDVS